MSRILSLAAGIVLLGCTGVAMAETATYPNRHAALGTSASATSTPQTRTAANEFATEAEAKGHCPGDTIVWVNTKTHVFHFAGTPAFGHTKHGAFMCQADAKRAGSFRAAKNEKPIAR